MKISILMVATLLAGAGRAEQRWQPYEWTPGPSVHPELMSPAVEITVYHDHFDDKPTVPYSSGLIINRHIWPGQAIKEFNRITRDSKGQDEDPTGTHLPLSLFPKADDGYGGEWLPKDNDQRTRHQQMWDYFAGHVAKAFGLFKARKIEQQSRHLMYQPFPANWEKELTDWEKFHAICQYASAWQSRQRGLAKSAHPMDVMFYGYHCGGVHQIFLALFHVAGELEDWIDGALVFDGKRVAVLPDAELKKDVEYPIGFEPGQEEATKSFTFPAAKRQTVDMADNNFLIEAYFRAIGAGGIAEKGYRLQVNAQGGVTFTAGTGTVTGGKVADGQWHHVLAEADRVAGKLRLYVDGKLAGEGEIKPGSLSNTNDFVVGRGLVGAIDFLRVARGTLADAHTTIDELYAWEFSGPQFRDFCGNQPAGKRDAGALEAQ